MKTSYDDLMEQGQRKGGKKGRARGAADTLFAVLSARSLRLTRPQRSRIATCTNPTQLRTWARRAATAESVADVLDPPRKHLSFAPLGLLVTEDRRTTSRCPPRPTAAASIR